MQTYKDLFLCLTLYSLSVITLLGCAFLTSLITNS